MKRIKEFLKKAADAVVRAYSWITGFGADKYMHVIAGALITLFFAFSEVVAPFAWLAGMTAGAIKEFVDWSRFRKPDMYDFLATTVGAFVTQLFLWTYLIIW